MANDNKELKKNAPCEEKQGMRELTEEELAHVTGGETSRRIRTDEPIARDVAVRAGCAIDIKKELGVAVAVDIDMARAVANGPGMK